MRKKRHGWAIAGFAAMIMVATLFSAIAQEATPPRDDTQYQAVIAILCHMSGQLRLVGPLASYGIFTPIRSDQRVYAQYVINILEGSHGKDYVSLPMQPDFIGMIKAWGISVADPGLIEGALRLADAVKKIPYASYPQVSQYRLASAAKNITFLLKTALAEARASLVGRDIDGASDHMRLTYACSFATLGTAGGTNPGSVTDLIVLLKGSPVCREQP